MHGTMNTKYIFTILGCYSPYIGR